MRGRWGRRAAAAGVGAVCLLGAVACGPASSAAAGSSGGSASSGSAGGSSAASSGGSYLALGDSVPFGYHVGGNFHDEASLVGYPTLVGEQRGLKVINATCPGETTASFLDTTAPSNGCEGTPAGGAGYRAAFPMHVPYAAPDQSQLALAVSTLKKTPDVRLVTLQIGANDAFLCQETTADHCATADEQLAFVQQVQTNLAKILTALHDDGGYRGKVVVVTYYSLDYSGSAATPTQGLDTSITLTARDKGATVADGFEAFRAPAVAKGGSSVTAGLVYPNDVHPTAAGQQLLARAVEAVAG